MSELLSVLTFSEICKQQRESQWSVENWRVITARRTSHTAFDNESVVNIQSLLSSLYCRDRIQKRFLRHCLVPFALRAAFILTLYSERRASPWTMISVLGSAFR